MIGCEARAAQDLLLHRGEPAAQIFGNDRLDVVVRNLLLLDQNKRLRDVPGLHEMADPVRDDRQNESPGMAMIHHRRLRMVA